MSVAVEGDSFLEETAFQHWAMITVYVSGSSVSLKQDRRWNADKPSAALDPYMPTWLTTSPANHRPANFWFFFKHWNEIVKSGATSGPADEHQH